MSLCKSLLVSASPCESLRVSASLCESLRVSASPCKSLRVPASLCKYLQVSASTICDSLKVCCFDECFQQKFQNFNLSCSNLTTRPKKKQLGERIYKSTTKYFELIRVATKKPQIASRSPQLPKFK